MKIAKLYIHDFQQFRDFELDFTDPKTGKPLDRVCLIGRNGTGKSTLLELLSFTVSGLPKNRSLPDSYGIAVDSHENLSWHCALNDGSVLRLKICTPDFEESIRQGANCRSYLPVSGSVYGVTPSVVPLHHGVLDSVDIVGLSKADEPVIVPELPNTQLNNALSLFKNFPAFNLIGGSASAAFWNLLIYNIKKRESDWQEFLNMPDNRARTVAEVQKQFDEEYPEILKFLADKWDTILRPAGLMFDYENAKRPVQLNENLQAYVRLLSGKELQYGALSTGIRNYLFRIGHIAALYFGRPVKNGFLFVDEPENSLYPDFLYDLIGMYESIISNTQFFVATHNPIIAAQFKPEERFILDFNDEYKVTVRRGVTPEGDDPNDILEKDFSVRSLYGQEGVRNWERFLDLRSKIQRESDTRKKRELMSEFLRIGNDYNFALTNALPEKAN